MPTDAARERRVALALARVLEEAPPGQPSREQPTNGAPAAPSALSRTGPRRRRLSLQEAHARAAAAMGQAAQLGAEIFLPDDPGYPTHLAGTPDPPRILFALGRTDLLRRAGVAVVGSRVHSSQGSEACARVVMAAVAAGVAVISGLAKGIDAIAHREALLLEGDTVAVLGSGLDVIYPRSNRGLYQAIRERGLILTEYPPGAPPARHTFVRRNRIIASLGAVTVVVEAGAESGALRTAADALDRGRDVMAVPGPITSASHVGSNRLLRDGAAPFLEPRDLWDLLRTPAVPILPRRPLAAGLPTDLSAMERQVALCLDNQERGLDELGQRLDTSAHELAGALLGLEIRGLVEPRPGRRFRLAQPWGPA